jgi:hypothetical protein
MELRKADSGHMLGDTAVKTKWVEARGEEARGGKCSVSRDRKRRLVPACWAREIEPNQLITWAEGSNTGTREAQMRGAEAAVRQNFSCGENVYLVTELPKKAKYEIHDVAQRARLRGPARRT